MTQGTADTDDHDVDRTHTTGPFLPGHDHSTKVMTAVVGLALAGVLAFALMFVTMALLGPRPVP